MSNKEKEFSFSFKIISLDCNTYFTTFQKFRKRVTGGIQRCCI